MSTHTDPDDPLAQATELLRQHTDTGWTAISGSVLRRALSAFRPSSPVRGRHDLGDFFVASDTVVAQLRQVTDRVPLVAATTITCATDERDEITDVTVQIIAAYGADLVAVARQVHVATAGELRELLGDLAPGRDAIHTHVHIGDITDDPRDVDS